MSGEKITEVVVKIPNWLEGPAVAIVLLYRRLRYGYPFRRIRLTQNKYAIIDPDDYPKISKYKWHAAKGGTTFYVVRSKWCKITKICRDVRMHRVIIEVPDDYYVNHINGNGLDNRKANLRPATAAQNNQNARRPKRNAYSKYRGVTWEKSKQRWRAHLSCNKRTIHAGYFNDELKAANAYDNAAKKYHREFAVLNFPSQ